MRYLRHAICMVLIGGIYLSLQTALSAQSVASRSVSGTDRHTLDAVLARRVTVNIEALTLKQALAAIAVSATHAGVQIQYQSETVMEYREPVSIHATDVALRTVLDRVLMGTHLTVVPLTESSIAITSMNIVTRVTNGGIAGRVTDATTKQPLHGVTILLDDAGAGITTGADGSFQLANVPVGSHRVTARLIGYLKQVRTVTVSDGQLVSLDIALSPGVNTLNQVVVTGTIIPTELKAVPNAITVITSKQIEERGITHIDQLFRGDVPGLFAQDKGASTVLDEVTMFSRGPTALSSKSTGVSTVLGTSNPIKTYVDGVELADPKYLSQIDPGSIERIEILTGPQASTIYGSNAINGVMQIFTKRGTSSTPQLTVNLLSGVVQNNFSSTLTPQHDYRALLSGVEGSMSYNAGSSWSFVGAYTPGKQTTHLRSFGGVRLSMPRTTGRLTADVTMQRMNAQNRQRGALAQQWTNFAETGWYSYSSTTNGLLAPTANTLAGQTIGLTINTALTEWWSHEMGVGQDVANTETRKIASAHSTPSDSMVAINQSHVDRRSMRYTTTVRVPFTASAHMLVTGGADAWQKLTTSMIVTAPTLTGGLNGSVTLQRQPEHNAGGFLQTQVALFEQFFVTYGLRAEWNPNFGAAAQPNYAPRYGVVYTHDVGAFTTKVRASYGRSTRPPGVGLKNAVKGADPSVGLSFAVPDYGDFDYILANTVLAPEYQKGGEGGLEVYWGSHGSLILTRYNQTVDGLIDLPIVDSARSKAPAPQTYADVIGADGYGYIYQWEYLNIGSLRNQGWELQSSANIGSLLLHGTYSWTKARSIGVNPIYRKALSFSGPQYRPGGSFSFLPEHTWALGGTYARARTAVNCNVTGIGRLRSRANYLLLSGMDSRVRLPNNRVRMTSAGYVPWNSGYASVDLTASHQISTHVEGLLQVQNLANQYHNDLDAGYATLGRQTKAGLRVRW